jgi:hypothetical protein
MNPTDNHLVVLRVLGTPDLRNAKGERVTSVLAQPKRLSLLTYLALAPTPVSRSAIVATFWPLSDETRARNALSQAVFHLRRSLGDDVIQTSEGDRLWVPPDRLWCDARALLASDRPDAAVLGAAGRELLEGWNADDSNPLQEWLDASRTRLRRHAATVVPPVPAEGSKETVAEPRWRARGMPVAALVAFAVVGALGAAVVGGAFAASRFGEAPMEDLVVLLPRVIASTDSFPVSAQTVLDEVLAHLPDDPRLRIVPAPTASSIPELRRQLAAFGIASEDTPDWILEVSLRVTSTEVRGVTLLYRSPTLDLPGRESFGLAYAAEEKVLVELPREIAERVTTMVEEVLADRR